MRPDMIRQCCTGDARRVVAAAARAIASSRCATALAVAAAVPAKSLPAVHAAPESTSDHSADDEWMHAYAAFGRSKYPRGFAHFEYVNPDAPHGGTLYLASPDRRIVLTRAVGGADRGLPIPSTCPCFAIDGGMDAESVARLRPHARLEEVLVQRTLFGSCSTSSCRARTAAFRRRRARHAEREVRHGRSTAAGGRIRHPRAKRP
jgi:hypothetical protein